MEVEKSKLINKVIIEFSLLLNDEIKEKKKIEFEKGDWGYFNFKEKVLDFYVKNSTLDGMDSNSKLTYRIMFLDDKYKRSERLLFIKDFENTSNSDVIKNEIESYVGSEFRPFKAWRNNIERAFNIKLHKIKFIEDI